MAVGVAKARLAFTLDARRLTLDYRKVPFSAWSELKRATGFTQSTLVHALGEADLDAVVAVIWLERKQRERKLRYADVYREMEQADDDVDFEIVKLVIDGRVIIDDESDDDESDDDEDPTAGG